MFNIKIYNKIYYQKNKKKIFLKRAETKEEKREYDKKYKKKNRKKVLKNQRIWSRNNPERIKKYSDRYYKKSKQQIILNSKKWCKENPEKYKKIQNKARKKRMAYPKFRLDKNMGIAIYHLLKENKANRHWENLTNFTLQDLIKRLEFQFNDKMNWKNYGSYWHIDHRKPKSLFYFNSAEEQTFKDCWCLANLQPMEKIENIKKSNKF